MIDLFNQFDKDRNLLPHDGIVKYFGRIFNRSEADYYLNALLENIAWKSDEANYFGKTIHTKRMVGWYGDSDFSYTYSNSTKTALPWTPDLLKLKSVAEDQTGEKYNSCLLNLYHNGNEGMAWHSDAEKDLKRNGTICSLSFGAERKFAFKNKESKESLSLILEHGSLLIMAGTCQTHWLHRLPPSVLIKTPRVNLTFRMIVKR